MSSIILYNSIWDCRSKFFFSFFHGKYILREREREIWRVTRVVFFSLTAGSFVGKWIWLLFLFFWNIYFLFLCICFFFGELIGSSIFSLWYWRYRSEISVGFAINPWGCWWVHFFFFFYISKSLKFLVLWYIPAVINSAFFFFFILLKIKWSILNFFLRVELEEKHEG